MVAQNEIEKVDSKIKKLKEKRRKLKQKENQKELKKLEKIAKKLPQTFHDLKRLSEILPTGENHELDSKISTMIKQIVLNKKSTQEKE